MSRLPEAFRQDRALRDAARAVLVADVEHARATLSGKGLAERVTGRIGDGAKDVFEVAKVNTIGRPSLLAGLVAIIALWFARKPIAELLGLDAQSAEDQDENATEAAGDAEAEAADASLEEESAVSDTSDEETVHDQHDPAAPVSPTPSHQQEPLSTGEMA
ncbi:MAG: hypothetical protein AAF291_16640 [Pseudomonadota bacterium]